MAGRLQAELYLGSLGWVDITDDVRQPAAASGGGITITHDRAAGQRVAEPGKADLVIANHDGRYSPRNPRSPYAGLLGRNTPIRVGLELFADDFDRTTATGWGAGWLLGGDQALLAVGSGRATQAHPTANQLVGAFRADELVDSEHRFDVAPSAMVTGAALVTGVIVRYQDWSNYYWIRAEFKAGSTAVMLKISKMVGGVATDLAVLDPVPGLTYSADALIRVRASIAGPRLSISAWSPAGPEPPDWQLTAVDTDIRGPGLTGLASWAVAGNTNPGLTAGFAAYRMLDRRLWMEVPTWPVRWNVPGTDAWTPIEAAGILRRLQQGAKPLRSALYRAITAAAPTAYWPLEDPAGSPYASSPIPDVKPARPLGYSRFQAPGTLEPIEAAGLPAFASGEGIPGSAACIDLSQGGVLQAPVPQVPPIGDGVDTGWRIEWVMVAPRDKAGDTAAVVLRWETNDAFVDHPGPMSWEVQADASGLFATYGQGLTAFGSASASFTVFDGLPHHYRIDADTFLESVRARLYVDGRLVATFSSFSATMAGAAGQIQQWILNPLEEPNGAEHMPIVGHIAIWSPIPTTPVATPAATTGWAGELDTDRVERLCDEHGIPVAVLRGPDGGKPMGPQRPVQLLDLLAECATVGQAILGEARERIALTYRPAATLYNQTPVELSYAAGHLAPPLEPVDDDQDVRNDITVKGMFGGEARAVRETGRLSVLPPEDGGIGVYDTEPPPVNVADPLQLGNLAGWLLHLFTWDEARYPQIRVNLAAPVWAADPGRLARVVALDDGGVVALTDLPNWLPPGEPRAMIRGMVEQIGDDGAGGLQRSIVWSADPASPYTIGVRDGDARRDTAGSELAAAIDADDTSLSVATTLGPAWTQNPAHMPIQLLVGEETVTVTAVAGTSSPQTMTVVRAADGIARAWPAGTPVRLAEATYRGF